MKIMVHQFFLENHIIMESKPYYIENVKYKINIDINIVKCYL